MKSKLPPQTIQCPSGRLSVVCLGRIFALEESVMRFIFFFCGRSCRTRSRQLPLALLGGSPLLGREANSAGRVFTKHCHDDTMWDLWKAKPFGFCVIHHKQSGATECDVGAFTLGRVANGPPAKQIG